MFYTGLDPFTLKEVYVPRTFAAKQMPRALLQFTKKENYTLVLLSLIHIYPNFQGVYSTPKRQGARLLL